MGIKISDYQSVCFSIVLSVFLATAAVAAEPVASARDIDVIDIPTADVVDHYAYNVSFRFGREGALQNRTVFGVFPRLNLGFGIDTEGVIGTGDARMNQPTLNMKLRIFDGHRLLPAIAIGYDGQGFVWNKDLDEYEQREKGLFLVTTSEIFVPNFNLHLGVNHFDFKHGNSTRGFLGLNYTYEQLVGLMVEYDAATEYDERRFNFGLKYYVTPVFTVDVAGRNVPEYPDSEGRETERIVKLVYTGSF
jgi:hypothetical protein